MKEDLGIVSVALFVHSVEHLPSVPHVLEDVLSPCRHQLLHLILLHSRDLDVVILIAMLVFLYLKISRHLPFVFI